MGGYGRGWRHRRQHYCASVPGFGRDRCIGEYPPIGRVYPPNPGALVGRWESLDDGTTVLRREDELRMLEEEEQMLRHQLDEVLRTIEALKNEVEKEV